MTTMPLASWLSASWRHDLTLHEPDYQAVVSAAQKLDQLVWDRHKLKLLFCDQPWLFRSMIEAEDARSIRHGRELATWPILGTHTDPSCRALDKTNFYALLGTRTDRPLPLFSTNTACLYDRPIGEIETLWDLFASRRLWSDFPERDCADLSVECDLEHSLHRNLPMTHVGTAWVRDDRRGKGIAADVVRLHRMVAWLRWGLPIFGTVLEDKDHAKGLRTDIGRMIGRVIEKRGTDERHSLVHLYAPDSIVADARAVLASPPPP